MSVTKERKQKQMDNAFRQWLFALKDEMVPSGEDQKSRTRRIFEAGYNAGRTDGYRSGMQDGADWGEDRHWR